MTINTNTAINAYTGKTYTAKNAVILNEAFAEKKYSQNKWLTFIQATLLSYKVKRHAKGIKIAYMANGKFKKTVVFNIDQCELHTDLPTETTATPATTKKATKENKATNKNEIVATATPITEGNIKANDFSTVLKLFKQIAYGIIFTNINNAFAIKATGAMAIWPQSNANVANAMIASESEILATTSAATGTINIERVDECNFNIKTSNGILNIKNTIKNVEKETEEMNHEIEVIHKFEFAKKQLKNLKNGLLAAAKNSLQRKEVTAYTSELLTRVLLDEKKEKINIVGCRGFKAIVTEIPMQPNNRGQLLMPNTFAKQIANSISSNTETVSMGNTGNVIYAIIKNKGYIIVYKCECNQEKFVDYVKVNPFKEEYNCIVNGKEFYNCIKPICKNKVIYLEYNGQNNIEVKTKNSENDVYINSNFVNFCKQIPVKEHCKAFKQNTFSGNNIIDFISTFKNDTDIKISMLEGKMMRLQDEKNGISGIITILKVINN